MRSFHTTRLRLTPWLLLTFVLQLGTCPCASAKHCLWLQLIGCADEDLHHADSSHERSDRPEAARTDHSHHCDGERAAPFVSGHARKDAVASDHGQLASALLLTAVWVSTPASPEYHLPGRTAMRHSSALPLRAELGVYLI